LVHVIALQWLENGGGALTVFEIGSRPTDLGAFMKQFVVLVTACAAFVVLYFVCTVGFRGAAMADVEHHVAAAPSTQLAVREAAPPKVEPPAPKLVALLPDSPGLYKVQFTATVKGKPLAMPA